MDEQRLNHLLQSVAQQLDKAAFAELFDLLAPRVKAGLMRAGLDAASAEDVLQDAMINVWTKAGLFDPARGNVFSWVYTIARNVRIDRLRRGKHTVQLDTIDWDPADDAETSEQRLVNESDFARVRAALSTLVVGQREVLELAFVQELSQAEIARQLGLPLGTVKSRMRLAYAHLKKILEHSQ